MARLIRPLRQMQLPRHQTNLSYLQTTSTALTSIQTINTPCFSFATLTSTTKLRCLNSPNYISPFAPENQEISDDSDSDVKKSRNEKKREARRAVRWGMQLAKFSAPQIKRILKVASLEREVYEALMLVKKYGPDVREGKRRQFNYIGKLLRDVEPDLMEVLIHSTKDGDWSRLQAFSTAVAGPVLIDNEELIETENDEDDDDEVAQECIELANRWLDGLVNKDEDITNEVYAITNVDFDRQELRKLVRRVHSAQDRKDIDTENEQKEDAAEKSLAQFLQDIAKQMHSDSDFADF